MQPKGLRPFGSSHPSASSVHPSASPTVKNATLSSIKELKVELSVATMIRLVQKAGIQKNIKIKTAKTSSWVEKFYSIAAAGLQKNLTTVCRHHIFLTLIAKASAGFVTNNWCISLSVNSLFFNKGTNAVKIFV
ncbi:MAG: hypothetical protein JWQ40_4585 [Segetibacter sp.]|nr:hypothetical protein [Segetibacter sp.]